MCLVSEGACLILPDKIILRLVPSFLPKVSMTFHMNWESVLSAFPKQGMNDEWRKLDLVRSLSTYIERRVGIRKQENLFIFLNSQ